MFRDLYNNKTTEVTIAIGQLTAGALFFDMRSCEYSSVNGKRKTTLLTLKEIRFFQQTTGSSKSGNMKNKNIDSVTITFLRQKNEDKEADITMHKSNDSLCLVRIWRKLVERILNYSKTNLNTPINTVIHKGKLQKLKSKEILKHNRN